MSLKRNIGITLGVFAAIGIGLGLSGMVLLDAAQQQFVNPDAGEFAQSIGQLVVFLLLFQGVMITFFTGPVAAAVTGLSVSREAESLKELLITSGVGSFVGFLLMAVLAAGIMLSTFETGGTGGTGGSGGGGNLELGQFVGEIILISLPTTVVGVVSGWLGSRIS